MLRIEALEVCYGESRVLRGVTLEVPPNGVVCLLGRNGAGKTTLLKSIMGLLPARSGRVIFDGRDITALEPYRRARAGIAYVPQGREILPQLTVRENLLLGGELAERVFELFPALRNMLNRKGGDLSGGQQQQLALARALLSQPRLLLLDEPTEGIQPSIIDEIEDVLARIKAEARFSVLLVEQYFEFAWRLADYCYVLEKGAVAAQGTTADLGEDAARRHLTV